MLAVATLHLQFVPDTWTVGCTAHLAKKTMRYLILQNQSEAMVAEIGQW